MAFGAQCRDGSRTRSHERIEYDIVLVGVQLDESLRQLNREGRGVTDTCRALRWNIPKVHRGLKEFVSTDRYR